MSLEEDIHAIRQNLERLIYYFTGNERSGKDDHRDGQRDSTLQRKTAGFGKLTSKEEAKWSQQKAYIVRSTKESRSWGPFKNKVEAQIWLNKANCNSKDFTIETLWLI